MSSEDRIVITDLLVSWQPFTSERLAAAESVIMEEMTIGTSLFLIAVGAIIRFAINDSIEDVDLSTVGLILIIVGIAGLLLGLFMMNRNDRDVVVSRERDPRDRY